MKELDPAMVGIGPFIPHHDTPFPDEPAGSVELTVFLLVCIRLMLPKVLLPATTALGTDRSLRQGKGCAGGRERDHAEPVSGGCAEGLSSV
jgi:biotin synthase